MGERRQINGLGVRARLDINSGGRERGRRHIAAYHRDLESDHCGIDDLGLIRSLLASTAVKVMEAGLRSLLPQ